MKELTTLEQIAEAMFYGGGEPLIEARILEHFEYRKGKGIEDLKKCRMKGSKLANYRAQDEPRCTKVYLHDVLKPRRV